MQTLDKKNKRSVDWLSAGFLVMATVSMAVSIPATFSVASMTHRSLVGAVMVVIIAELMAFGAKLATRWFPAWYKPLNGFAVTMLAAAVLPNAVEGWNALWRADAAEGAWLAIRDVTLWGVPVFALLITLVWAALPPVGVYLALTFWVRRRQELETEQTPEAVVNRRLQPIIIEMQVQQKLDQALLGLMEERQRQYAALTVGPAAQLRNQPEGLTAGPVFQAPRLADAAPAMERHPGPYNYQKPPKAPRGSEEETPAEQLRAVKERPTAGASQPAVTPSEAVSMFDLGHYIYGAGPAPEVAPEALEPAAQPEPKAPSFPAPLAEEPAQERSLIDDLLDIEERFAEEQPARQKGLGAQLDGLLASAGLTRESAKALLGRLSIKNSTEAYTALRRLGKLPEGMNHEMFDPLYDILMEKACNECGEQLTPGQLGVAVKYSRKHGQPVRCTACRKA